jgi:hypothetical protein
VKSWLINVVAIKKKTPSKDGAHRKLGELYRLSAAFKKLIRAAQLLSSRFLMFLVLMFFVFVLGFSSLGGLSCTSVAGRGSVSSRSLGRNSHRQSQGQSGQQRSDEFGHFSKIKLQEWILSH